MINKKRKKERGISLVSLAIAVVIIIILSNITIYYVRDNLRVENLKQMQNDITNLRDKIASYYIQNGKIPANIKYTNINAIQEAGLISNQVDRGDFLVIDLAALENLTLNYGKDYEKVREDAQNANNYLDLYIINEASHNIFYVEGITIDKEVYYTDYEAEEVDTKEVNLKYVDNIQIPEGYHYVRGKKNTGIIIENQESTEQYKWIVEEQKIQNIPEELEINSLDKEDFLKSVNAYQGYYKNTTNNKVIYLAIEKWSLAYDKEGIYKDKNGDTISIPEGFKVSQIKGEDTIEEGLVVKDNKENQWVWIEVPKTLKVYPTAGLAIEEFTQEAYQKIEEDLQKYTANYRIEEYTDTWKEENQHGFASSQDYQDWKKAMLKSIYQKGGFFVGRYETGATSYVTALDNAARQPIIGANAYAYNYVTCKQAQMLSKSLGTETRTGSLMFGIQWDLILKFIEEKESKTQNELKNDSSMWGNYKESTFDVVRGKYKINTWAEINQTYHKTNTATELTTGATNRNSVCNIYDLAGNMYEWTLEYSGKMTTPCTYRGGCYQDENLRKCCK